MMMSEDYRTIVIDTGGDTTKAGFANDLMPCSTFPTIVGRPVRPCGVVSGIGIINHYVGHDVASCKVPIHTRHPLQRGEKINWDDLEFVWYQIFYQHLSVPPEEHPLLYTEPPLNRKQDREKVTEVMFDTFYIPAFYISSTAQLALYATGRTTGLVVETGHNSTHTVPVVHGHTIPHGIREVNVSGSQLTEYIARQLTSNNTYSFPNEKTKKECVHNIKEKLCYVPLDSGMTSHSDSRSSSYLLPDGKTVNLSDELFRCPDSLFRPSLLCDTSQQTAPGIHESLQQSIDTCDTDTRKHLYGNIVLSGGNSLFPGMRERLEKEVTHLSPGVNKVIAPTERTYLPWIGGAMLASLSSFQQLWTTRDEYEETGPTIMHRRLQHCL